MATDITKYQDYQPILDALQRTVSWGAVDQGTRDTYTSQINTLTDQFRGQFQNLVGRGPNDEELSTFLNQYVIPNTGALTNAGSGQRQMPGQYLKQFISDTYQQSAEDYAQQQLQGQTAEANRLADLFRTQGNEAINNTEKSLLDYQTRLFDKLRPNLLTSLHAQGLLDTGALNESFAGAAKDLSDRGTEYLMSQRLANDQNANAISYAGAAAPYQYNQQNIMNRLPYLQGQGETAINQGYNTFLTNMNFQNQMALLNQQAANASNSQPSFGRTFLQSLGSSMGNNLGANLNGPGWLQGMKNSGAAAGMAG